jgi:hypothetical protein
VNRKLALFFSYLFQPLVIPSLVFAFLLYALPDAIRIQHTSKHLIMIVVVGTTLIIPLLSIVTMKLTKTIGSLHLHGKEERLFPFSMISFFYVMTTYLFYLKLSIDPTLVLALATITVCVVLLTAITFFWKISAHMTGVAGLLSIVAVASTKYPNPAFVYPLLLTILLTGFVASARLYLNSHTLGEVVGGFLLGFMICYLSFHYLL